MIQFAVMPAACHRTSRQPDACDNSRSRRLDSEPSSRTGNKRCNAPAGDTEPPATPPADRRSAAGDGSATVPSDRGKSWQSVGGRRRPGRRLRPGGAGRRRGEELAVTT